jgi:Rieske Fe-S protein
MYPDENSPCLLIRTDEHTFVAYDQKCSHLTCAVQPEVSTGRLRCPCHHGYFELASGRPLAGPPRRPLARVKIDIRSGVVYATGIEETLS